MPIRDDPLMVIGFVVGGTYAIVVYGLLLHCLYETYCYKSKENGDVDDENDDEQDKLPIASETVIPYGTPVHIQNGEMILTQV